MEKDKMIDAVVNNLRKWLKTDPEGFWEHVCDLERDYLQNVSQEQLESIYEESI